MKQSELIGYKLKKYRVDLKISQEQLAEKLNVRQNTVSGYEKDGIHDIDLIMDINHRLGINLLLNSKEDIVFNQTILNKIYSHYTWKSSIDGFQSYRLLSVKELQDILLYGYGNNGLLDCNLQSMENDGLIKLCKNELDESDDNIYIIMTAKGVLSIGPNNNDFPGKLTFEHLSETDIQELLNPKIANDNIELGKQQKKMVEEIKKKSIKTIEQIKNFNKKQETAKNCIETDKVMILSINSFDKLVKESIYEEKKELIQSYFNFMTEQLPSQNKTIELLKEVYQKICSSPKVYDGIPKRINRVYKKWIRLFYNLLLEAYRKRYFNDDKYEHFQYTMWTSELYKYAAPLGSLEEEDLDEFLRTVLSDESRYEYIAESMLLKAIISYLLENESISENAKNIENVKKLLYAMPINENTPYSVPPLDCLFEKAEISNPEYKCVEMYKQFKLLNMKDQQRALFACISACTKYLNRDAETPQNAKNFNEFVLLEKKMDEILKSRNDLKIISEKNAEIYCCILSPTIEEFHKNYDFYREIKQSFKIPDETISYDKSKETLVEILKEKNIRTLKDFAIYPLKIKHEYAKNNKEQYFETEPDFINNLNDFFTYFDINK